MVIDERVNETERWFVRCCVPDPAASDTGTEIHQIHAVRTAYLAAHRTLAASDLAVGSGTGTS